jgi:hypothetical protein
MRNFAMMQRVIRECPRHPALILKVTADLTRLQSRVKELLSGRQFKTELNLLSAALGFMQTLKGVGGVGQAVRRPTRVAAELSVHLMLGGRIPYPGDHARGCTFQGCTELSTVA